MTIVPFKHGGRRAGAGRPKGSNKYGEPTKPVRIPESMITDVLEYIEFGGMQLPLYSSKVSAGFPSPADDYMEGKLDLNHHLVRNPAATFFVRVSGESMLNAGIHPDDILVVDRSIQAAHGKIVIAVLDGELTVKRLYQKDRVTRLMPENPDYPPIDIRPEHDFSIWGVVTNVIHAV